MKKLLYSLAAAACLIQSCSVSGLRTGDLLFVGIPADYSSGDMAGAVAASTGKGDINWIHVAMVDVDAEGEWIVDATIKHGVDRHPLDTFLTDFTLRDGSLPYMEVFRPVDRKTARASIEDALGYLGEEYDVFFMEGNGRHYCSELVYDSYAGTGKQPFKTVDMNFLGPDGEMPAYWVRLFDSIGAEIPQGKPGTNPQDMHREAASSSSFVKVEWSPR